MYPRLASDRSMQLGNRLAPPGASSGAGALLNRIGEL